ncbi:MAG: flagellar motor stator protein MotA [Deltaproteobacteria bacterium]|jgi:chemotaxis protein MotA|nr:flagellar motor stator protein MotA [Deltaproteobacteria bacterium]
MLPIIGVVVVIGCVLTGYLMHHGVLGLLWQPNEVIIICGAAFGSFLIANPPSLVKEALSSIPKIFTGKELKKQNYVDVLLLLFEFLSIARREGMLALEEHANKPDSSAIFTKYPSIIKNHHLKDFLADNLKVFVSGNIEPTEFENLMDIDTDVHEHHGNQVPTALTTVSDSLPGLGIVAAVLGIITTMRLMTEPPEVLGASVGAALCGTFLGLLLSYGYMAPMAKALENQAHDQDNILKVAKAVLVAFSKGLPPVMAIEFARRAVPSNCRPGYEELEELLKSVKK